MAFIQHWDELFVKCDVEQVENKLFHGEELIKVLSENNIRFEVHLFLLKLYDDASFLQFQDANIEANKRYNNILETIRNCIDIKTLDLSDCSNIPTKIEDFPYLTTIIFPTYLNFIPRIHKCPSIKRITIPQKGVECIETRNFENYPQIDELVLDEHLNKIDTNAFSSCIIKKVDLSQCKNLDQQNIKVKAFSYSNIEEIVFPNHITILPFGAFSDCKHLKTIKGSDLFAVFMGYDEKRFVRLDREVPSDPCKYCFDKCNDLQYVQFSQELSIEGIRRLFSHTSYDEGNRSTESDSFYYDKRCGIVLEIDQFYSYIWSFTDFSFYLSNKLDNTYLNKIVSFYNSNDRNIEMKNGKCWIYSNRVDHIALGVSLGCNYFFNNKFDRIINRDIVLARENDQNKALKIFENQVNLADIDIRAKVSELEKLIDNLDIDSIINSYHATSHYKYISRYRKDDEEEFWVNIEYSYTDAYMETLLPTQYDDANYITDKELKIYVDNCKKNARERYNKEEHKCFIVNKFILDTIENEAFVEKCLRINEARDLLIRYKNKVDGNQKVILLNTIIQ